MGTKYRHPEKYVILSEPDVRDIIGGDIFILIVKTPTKANVRGVRFVIF